MPTRFFRHLYSRGNADVTENREFRSSGKLAESILSDFAVGLPKIAERLEDEGTVKQALELADGYRVESVYIPMADWSNALRFEPGGMQTRLCLL